MNRIVELTQFDRTRHTGENFGQWRSSFTSQVTLLTLGLSKSQAEQAMLCALRNASKDRTYLDVVEISQTFEEGMNRLENTFGLDRDQKEMLFWEKFSTFKPIGGEKLKETTTRLIALLHRAVQMEIGITVSQVKRTLMDMVPFVARDFVVSRLPAITDLRAVMELLDDLSKRYGDYTIRREPELVKKAKIPFFQPVKRGADHLSREVKIERKCYSCGKTGHYANSCPDKGQINNFIEEPIQSATFVVDTGASSHVFGKDLVKYCFQSDGKTTVTTPFGCVHEATIAHLLVGSHDGSTPITLKGMLDPTRSINLIKPDSISWRAGRGGVAYLSDIPFNIETSKDGFPIITLKVHYGEDTKKQLVANTVDNMCKRLHWTIPEREMLSTVDLIKVFHHRLLHPGVQRTYNTLRHLGIMMPMKDVNQAIDECEYCSIKLTTAHSVNQIMDTVPYKKGNALDGSALCLYADVGFMKESAFGNRAVSVIREKNTGYLWIRPIKSTAEVKGHVIDTVNWLSRKVNHRPVVSFQCDSGSEYLNKELLDFFKGRDISIFTNPKNSKESNGTAERSVREAKKLISVALQVFRLRRTNWDWCCETAAYANNITCQWNQTSSPAMKLLGESPDYRYMPGRPIWVKEKGARHPIQGVYMCTHYTGVLFDYLVSQGDMWDWKEEHPRFLNPKADLITREVVYNSINPYTVEVFEDSEVDDVSTPTNQDDITPALNNLDEPAESVNHYVCASNKEIAMKKELDNFISHQVFREKYEGIPVVPTMWLFTVKADGTDKARLVVLGNQWESSGIVSTEPPTIESLLIFLAVIACNNTPCIQADISTAFLHAPIDEPVNVLLPKQLPRGFPYRGVVGLQKAVYGLAQSPKLFEQHMDKILTEIKLEKWCPGIYKGEGVLIFVYVDDLLISGNNAEAVLDKIRERLNVGKTTSLNVNDTILFLGAKITREPGKIIVSLRDYAKEHYTPGIRGSIRAETMCCNEQMPKQVDLLHTTQQALGVLGWISRFYPKASVYHSILSSFATKHPCRKILAGIQRVINLYSSAGHERHICGYGTVELVLMSDASHSLARMEARVGLVIAIKGTNMEYNEAQPILVKTKKVKRLVKSAFEAELEGALMLTECYEKHKKLLSLLPVTTTSMISDSKSLCASVKSGKTDDPFSSARLALLIQRMHDQELTMTWQPRRFQLADAMTKL